MAQNHKDLLDSVKSDQMNEVPRSVLWNIDKHYLNSFIGRSSLVHLAAIGATY